MNIANPAPSAIHPRWDGARILFQVEIAGKMVSCDISKSALQQLGDQAPLTSGDLLRRFVAARGRIAAIAWDMFVDGAGRDQRMLHIQSGDIHDPPSAPAVALQAARRVLDAQPHHVATRLAVAA